MKKKFMAVMGLTSDPASAFAGMTGDVRRAFQNALPAQIGDMAGAREIILAAHPPIFQNVFCQQIVLAYGVGRNWPIPVGPQTVTVVGRSLKARTQALLVMVGDRLYRDDGKPFHITISVAPGTAPAEAGDFRHDDATTTIFDADDFLEITAWAYIAPCLPIVPQRNKLAA